MKWVFESLGITKQAYYQMIKRNENTVNQNKIILDLVLKIRKERPKTGTFKLYTELKPILIKKGIKIGRNKLNDILRSEAMLVKKTKRFHITTDSKHNFYKSPNRLKDLDINHSEQAFVADITYIKTDKGHTYLALVTDIYSKKIMGYQYADHMKAELVINALKMAKKNCIHHHDNIIHHSDRGIQYCCPAFSDFAVKNGFVLSTTQQYDPYENAVAERINGILKYEFGLKDSIVNDVVTKKMIEQAIRIYNEKRLHLSLDLNTPQFIHNQYNGIKWKVVTMYGFCN